MSLRRTIYQSSACSCSTPLFAALAKGRRAAVHTNVGKYVVAKHPPIAKKLTRVLRRQAKDVARLVRRAYAVEKLEKAEPSDAEKAALIDQILSQLNGEDLGSDLSDVLDGAMAEAFRKAAALGLAQAGFDASDRSIVEQVDAKAVEYAAQRSAELVTDLADTTLEDLRDLIRQGVSDGMSASDLADRIDEMGAFGDARAETIARTELASAHVQGNVEGWRQTGEVEKKESILGDLHDIDDICDDCADAGEVDIEDDFAPGYDFPPYHPNCICDVKPVLSAEPDE